MKNQSEDGLVRFGVNAPGTLAAAHISGASCYVRLDKRTSEDGIGTNHDGYLQFLLAGEVRHDCRVYDLRGMRSPTYLRNDIPDQIPETDLREACEAAFSFAFAAWEHQDRHGCSNPDSCPERG